MNNSTVTTDKLHDFLGNGSTIIAANDREQNLIVTWDGRATLRAFNSATLNEVKIRTLSVWPDSMWEAGSQAIYFIAEIAEGKA